MEIVSRAEGEIMTELTLNGIGRAVRFSNGVCVLNTTPHPLTMQDVNGELITVPISVLINAKAEEKAVNDLFVETVFVGTPEGTEIIRDIEGTFKGTGCSDRLVIVGSIIAAQAYKGKVVGLCPVPGYERVAPSEKRMRCDKFTIFTE